MFFLWKNGRRFADGVFKCIFVNDMFCISIQISLKFVPKGQIGNNPALVKIIAWCRIGNKPLSQPMLTRFPDAYMRHEGRWLNMLYWRRISLSKLKWNHSITQYAICEADYKEAINCKIQIPKQCSKFNRVCTVMVLIMMPIIMIRAEYIICIFWASLCQLCSKSLKRTQCKFLLLSNSDISVVLNKSHQQCSLPWWPTREPLIWHQVWVQMGL